MLTKITVRGNDFDEKIKAIHAITNLHGDDGVVITPIVKEVPRKPIVMTSEQYSKVMIELANLSMLTKRMERIAFLSDMEAKMIKPQANIFGS